MHAPTQPHTPAPPAARPQHRGRRRTWAVPAVLGAAFGAYAGFLDHDGEGASTGRSVVLGLVAAVIAAAVCYLVGREQSVMMRELRAVTYGGLLGAAMGLLFSLSGATWLSSTFMGLVFGTVMALVAFYVFYTHED